MAHPTNVPMATKVEVVMPSAYRYCNASLLFFILCIQISFRVSMDECCRLYDRNWIPFVPEKLKKPKLNIAEKLIFIEWESVIH